MALKTVLESLEGVDDAVRGLYKEVDKKFVLDVEGVDEHPQVRALKTAHESQKARNQELSGKVAELETKVRELPEDFDASKWLEFKVSAEKDKDKKDKDVANLQQMFDTRVQNLEQQNAAKLAEKDAQIVALDKQLDDMLVGTTLTDLLVSNHVDEELLSAARLVIGQRVKVVKDQAGARAVVADTNVGDQPIKDYVRAWAETEGKRFVVKPTGIDATGGDKGRFARGDNPFSAAHWNKTKQSSLPVEQREDYARAAGFKDYQTAIMSARPAKAA